MLTENGKLHKSMHNRVPFLFSEKKETGDNLNTQQWEKLDKL